MASLFNFNCPKLSLGALGVLASLQTLAQSDTSARTVQTGEESTNYAFIGIGAALLVIVIIVLYRRQYRKFNE